jgi:hypothetical protein
LAVRGGGAWTIPPPWPAAAAAAHPRRRATPGQRTAETGRGWPAYGLALIHMFLIIYPHDDPKF